MENRKHCLLGLADTFRLTEQAARLAGHICMAEGPPKSLFAYRNHSLIGGSLTGYLIVHVSGLPETIATLDLCVIAQEDRTPRNRVPRLLVSLYKFLFLLYTRNNLQRAHSNRFPQQWPATNLEANLLGRRQLPGF
jgi:hypothetical protein